MLDHQRAHHWSIRLTACLLSIAAGAGLAWLLPGAFTGVRPAYANDIIVNPGDSIQAAIDGAADGDTVLIQPGLYTESLTLNKPVSLMGVGSGSVTLMALSNERVLTVTGATISNSVVISGLTFTGGYLTNTLSCPAGCGGGLLITGSARPLLQNITVYSNYAGYAGGGLYLWPGSPVTFESVYVVSNTAQASQGGGGLFASGTSTPTLLNSTFAQNRAATSGGGGIRSSGLVMTNSTFISNSAQTAGGGAFVSGPAILWDGQFVGNRSNNNRGGALLATQLTVNATQFLSNYADIDGGAILAQGLTFIDGAVFQNNRTNGTGGALQLSTLAQATVQNTTFFSNSAGNHGGAIVTTLPLTLTNSTLEQNRATGSGTGGAIYAGAGLLLERVTIMSNTAASHGGGVYAAGWLTDNRSTLYYNRCLAGSCLGGGMYLSATAALTATQFISNSAGGSGGGLYHVALDAELVNVLLARNAAGVTGAAVYGASPGQLTLLHATITDWSQNLRPAVVVATGTVRVSNSIVASHTVGLELLGGALAEDHNLFYNNITNTVGAAQDLTDLVGDPDFLSPTGHDYHLGRASAAIDKAAPSALGEDFEGDLRPQGDAPDIGFDEKRLDLFLPLIMK